MLDHAVQHESRCAGGQADRVDVVDIATGLEADVGVRLEELGTTGPDPVFSGGFTIFGK